jgi:hypothetical protein
MGIKVTLKLREEKHECASGFETRYAPFATALRAGTTIRYEGDGDPNPNGNRDGDPNPRSARSAIPLRRLAAACSVFVGPTSSHRARRGP